MTHPQYLDTLGVWDATVGLPEQLRVAVDSAEAVLHDTALPRPADIRSVVVFGMGTSATAAEAVAAYAVGRASVPIWVGNGYESPAFVGPHTLAFAVSASGGTEETIAAASAARAGGPTSSSYPAPACWRIWRRRRTCRSFGYRPARRPGRRSAPYWRPCC